MSLEEQIQKELTEAMKLKDELRLSVLRMVKSALKLKSVEKMRPLEDAESLQVLQTLVKQRRESVEQFTKGGRMDLANKETKEIAIIESFLPTQLSDSEIDAAVDAAIAEIKADSLKQMGQVMAVLRDRFAGSLDMGKAGARVKAKLS